METSVPSRTEAIMPHPHEQKLHEVVNSRTSLSFNCCVAARTEGTSRRPASARPSPPPPTAVLRYSLRLSKESPFPEVFLSHLSIGSPYANTGFLTRTLAVPGNRRKLSTLTVAELDRGFLSSADAKRRCP